MSESYNYQTIKNLVVEIQGFDSYDVDKEFYIGLIYGLLAAYVSVGAITADEKRSILLLVKREEVLFTA